MSRAPVVVTALMLTLAPNFASANEQAGGVAAGAVTGGVAGAIVGGPVGAAIGAIVGGTVGVAASSPGPDAVVEQPAPPDRRGGRAPVYDPDATGSVLETTCTRDARGMTRCRRQVVQ
ncbi:MAG TPA: hypothetical protein VHN20_07865 [Beijerinckiaceae bacterium]|nr:hypothetical protein [Beijerinckiaceae bacterium]